jgi:thiol-disulfide isomerase/thioredoxin
MTRFLAVFALLFIAVSCGSDKRQQSTVKTGIYRAAIEIQGRQLPFNFELINTKGGGYHAYLINAGERLLLDEVTVTEDSIDMPLHIFDANIKAKIDGDSLHGVFIKNYEKDYRIPFMAKYGQGFRFAKGNRQTSAPDFSGTYEVNFVDDEDTTQAVGVFEQHADSVTGTFLTSTGDYRYLQGNVDGEKMQLSTFDGNHAYLFTATKGDDGRLSGDHYSGKTYHAKWTGIKNEKASLPDAESLTFLKKGFDKIEFSFPDANGKTISLTDDKYKNKVVIIQLFGTWCPNCMDETKFLSPWYDKNASRGVEVIGIAYERKDNFDYASARLKKMIEKLNVKYDFVIGGVNDKVKAAETLPMLNSVVAFPTTLFIGKDGKVKKIHTGFSGPGTGVYYEKFVEHFNETVNDLLSESNSL